MDPCSSVPPCSYGAADHLGLAAIRVPERVDERQRRLAFGEVVADVLAELLGVAVVVERVVDQLEGDAEVLAVAGERRFDGCGRVRDDRGDLGARFEQPRRLAVDDFHVAHLGGVRVAGVHELHHFARGDRVGRVGHHADHRGGVERSHHLEGARVEEVADQHGGGVAERLVGGLTPAPAGRLVDDVVVQQGRRMDELDERRGRHLRGAGRPGGPGGEHDEERPEALAPGADDVFADLVDEQHVARQLAARFRRRLRQGRRRRGPVCR